MTARADQHAIAFEAFGLRVGVTADDPRVLDLLDGLGPAGSRPCDPAELDCSIGVTTTEHGQFNVRFDVREGEVLEERDMTAYIAGDSDLDLAIASLDAHVQSYIALHAPDHIFIRAAVVAHQDRAIALPGGPVTGKTALARELVRHGATLYSEDWAAIDHEGLVHPYLRPTIPGVQDSAHTNGNGPDIPQLKRLPLSAIVLTTYWPAAEWQPQRRSRGEAILALMQYAEPGSERPEETFKGITGALASEPVILESDRGDAETVAPLLLADVERALSEVA